MPKIILRSCPMKILPTVNISTLNYWLLICIAKNFIWTTLKMIFSIFRFFCTLSNIVQTIHQWKYDLCIFQMMHKSQFHKIAPHDWFCAPGSHVQQVCMLLIFRGVFRRIFALNLCWAIAPSTVCLWKDKDSIYVILHALFVLSNIS